MDDTVETLEVTVDLNLSIKLFCHEINSFLINFEMQLKGNKIISWVVLPLDVLKIHATSDIKVGLCKRPTQT